VRILWPYNPVAGFLHSHVPNSVGFGDFVPTKIATKILLLPLALLGIAQLGSILSLIVGFFSLRAARRKARSRALSERQRQLDQDRKQTPPDLLQEIDFLVQLNASHDMKDQLNELLLSIAGLLVFWFVGAAIFTGTEVRYALRSYLLTRAY
jgi:potassium channel subfamily K